MSVTDIARGIRERLLTAEEAADHLGLRVQTLAQWRMVGRGPAFIKMGRAIRYRQSAIEAYLAQHTVGGEAE